jgi:hypothetical protein
MIKYTKKHVEAGGASLSQLENFAHFVLTTSVIFFLNYIRRVKI